jgi:heme-degrading monooxygenase HmoA
MYAVIFSSTLSAEADGYSEAAERMAERCSRQPGFIGMESVRDDTGRGITVCLWESLEAIAAWRDDEEHAEVRTAGRDRWYDRYQVLVCEVVRDG